MENTVVITSENLVTNKKYREKFGAKIDSMKEALAIIQDGVEKTTESSHLVGPFEDKLNPIGHLSKAKGKHVNSESLQLNVKLFLREYNQEMAKEAIHHLTKSLDTEYVDNVYVTVPAVGVQYIGISAHSDEELTSSTSEGEDADNINDDHQSEVILDPEREKYAADLAGLWNELSSLQAVDSLGLCDVETDVFKRIYYLVDQKPKNVQVNLKSCCVVPPELKQFAAAKNIKLYTHSDSPEILGDEFCNQVLNFGSAKFRPLWILKFRIFKELRGVLLDHRYMIALERV